MDVQPKGAGKVSWNFEKFLIGRNGKVIGRFSPQTAPDDEKLLGAVEQELNSK